jgi:ribonuclease P protein component
VVRHHFTRLVREAYRLHEEMFISGLDIVVVARIPAKGMDFHQVESSLLRLADLHRITVTNGLSD